MKDSTKAIYLKKAAGDAFLLSSDLEKVKEKKLEELAAMVVHMISMEIFYQTVREIPTFIKPAVNQNPFVKNISYEDFTKILLSCFLMKKNLCKAFNIIESNPLLVLNINCSLNKLWKIYRI